MKILRSVLPILGAFLMTTAAQAQQTRINASVPFNFIVGDRAYEAGDYSLNGKGTVIQIVDSDHTATVNVVSNSCTNVTPAPKTVLVFRHLGGEYYLYQVWTAGYISGREFPPSKTEIRLAQEHEKSDLVIVAANISK
jgi:hypothetical protein